jgi:acyl-CoA thioesterase
LPDTTLEKKMDWIYDFARKDRFAQDIGLELVQASKGYAKVRLEIREKHLNGVNVLHGGVIFALADFAFAMASNSHGTVSLAINAHISYFKAVNQGVLFAEAREVSFSPKLATYSIPVTYEDGSLIADFQGMVYRKKDVIEI